MLNKNRTHLLTALSIATLTATLTACGGGDTAGTSTEGDNRIAQVPLKGEVALNGAGASFPAPLYQNWFVTINQLFSKLLINYQSTGSGAGVEQFIQGTIDFGASDVAMSDEDMARVSRGVLLLPMTAGSIVMAYNLPGVEGLKLSREAYVGIFLGTITRWNDAKIAADNPDLKLPDEEITVVHRADGSGTTGVFTKFLSAVSPEWKKSIGEGKAVQWPTKKGKFLGGRGNEGVTALIQQNPGSIGYIEYGFAKNNNLPMATLQNQAGKFVAPDETNAAATLANVELPENLRAFIVDPPGENSYPIVTYTWMLVYKKYDDPQKALAMEAMIEFGLNQGQEQAAPLGYIPLPKNVRERVAAAADVIYPDYTIKVD
ncbi:MAG: phosphate ABC transporter substrate-binding protein PstS [Microcystis sp. M54BS1]|uniref:phosphate ABC transporter substrate-binding protein PstS n=1 Tax=unclassified Microcystis TaxID=2643300 RepID=UPI00257A147F|nr:MULTISPECIES: phosphate ABC transporter substrate-binding protein PstS [unclassified Microcystis]MCA2539891.1 phosphate ABC transporter substrate-binding protein PstS [Microcystis sp. M54BS1]MCA2596114.1 phosphate ABC transporter substrate-binding protein PstS [Microcystis sp. M38BS1]MCA2609577.1 phosphate ABC transporter substrate-binding protein PstS [Microcystis sp. M27BS1]MCA2506393.1 phosphate ABC transporter substrate-binding protein PstS [Microcystis sp. M62BS1]MCA2513418.1 phosphate